jgi:hypothetical protein
MGWTRTRVTGKGEVRFTASYRDLRGDQRSAGTFMTRKAADRAWQREEVKLAEGRLSDPPRQIVRLTRTMPITMRRLMAPPLADAHGARSGVRVHGHHGGQSPQVARAQSDCCACSVPDQKDQETLSSTARVSWRSAHTARV